MLAALCLVLSAPALAQTPAAPALTAIYPSGDVVPANHLKFYLHFSEPMKQGVFLEHCTLLDGRKQPVLEPFRETELWSEDRKRLTLWLHPGRQKTGVNLNVEFGPVLETERRYTLVISGRWPSENGVPLGKDVRKPFRAAGRARAQLDASQWRITAPAVGTLKPLGVSFPAPLDHALLLRCLRVVDAEGALIAGAGSAARNEKGWQFTPKARWKGGEYRLEADSVLEDLAGNSLARPFEVDLRGPPPRETPGVLEIRFRPSPSRK